MSKHHQEDAPRRLGRWYLITLVIGLAITVGVAFVRGFTPNMPGHLAAACFSDGFFVSGFLLAGVGALIWASTTGFFDMMSYGVKSLVVLFSSLRHPKDHRSFYDYKTERETRRGKTNFVLLIIGAGLLLLSGLCLYLYYALMPV